MANSRFDTAAQVFETFPAMARELTAKPSDEAPLDYLARLANGDSPEDAVTFCAYVLDRRQTVWWASQCLRRLGQPRTRDEDVALKLAEAWVRDPEEHRRLAALDLGLNGDHNLPAVWASLAAGMAGGTMRIGDVQGPPVPPHAAAQSARVAVLGALAAVPARERRDTLVQCVDIGRELLTNGGGS
jgi:hypothetical protein